MGAGRPPGRSTKQRRQEFIRHSLLAGVAEYKIIDQLRAGVIDPNTGQTIYRSSSATVKRDLLELGEGWRRLHDDPLVQERVVGGVLTRLTRIAVRAEEERRYNAAVQANLAIVRLIGLRAPRWRPDVEVTMSHTVSGSIELSAALADAGLTRDQLLALASEDPASDPH